MAANLKTIISSETESVEILRGNPTVIIGERINPTGRKKVLAALQEGNFDIVRQDAVNQVAAGAHILDVNAGVPGADEPELLVQVMRNVMEVTDVPLSIDTADPEALEAALQFYQRGSARALVNSVNGETRSMEAVLPLVKEHGAAVIGLCMDDDGIPETPEARLAVADKILERAGQLGIPPENVVIDPLALTMGSDHNSGRIALQTIELVVEKFGVNVTMGVSNISFGLPDRKYINATYIAMAIYSGITCPIMNPLDVEASTAIRAADLSMGRDEYGMGWIRAYRERQKVQEG